LDGIFQDVSAIQLSQLQITANQQNASNLDAVIQQFQANMQFNQIAGAQNAAAVQQNAAYSASAALQTQLFNQQSQLVNLQLVAQQQLVQAQAARDALPANATDAQKAAAAQAVTIATDNLTAITNQSAAVKTLLGTGAAPTPGFVAPTPQPLNFPTPFLAPTIPGTTSSTPFQASFPASKQIQNQINLLWERLAQLLSTLTQADDEGRRVSLVEFHTGITAGISQKKHALLSTQYRIKCNDDSDTGSDDYSKPRVLDLYPRNAAVNIANEKYKDSRIGLGALLSFFSMGANVAYNREHLRITQALSESAYTTGFGIQTNSFGWVIGPALGEDVPAPGDRTTFALISTSDGCSEPTLQLVNAEWNRVPVVKDSDESLKDLGAWKIGNAAERCDSSVTCVTRVEYTPAEFDSANPGSATVSVDIKLGFDIDRQETVSANGIFLKRVRDTFARATGAGGSGGLLEANSITAGTWIPVNSRELILNLSPAVFTGQFPSILLNSPRGAVDLTSRLTCNTEVLIAGQSYTCPEKSFANFLPSIGTPRASVKHFAVARWFSDDALKADGSWSERYHVIVTMLDESTSTARPANSAAIPALQIISGSNNQPWSGRARAIATQGDQTFSIPCEPRGELLDCDASDLDQTAQTEFEISDSGFATGPIRGSGLITKCQGSQCARPLIWENLSAPRWDGKSQWVLHLSMINVLDGDAAVLDSYSHFSGTVVCPQADDQPCEVDIPLPKDDFALIADQMSLEIKRSGKSVGSIIIGNLRMNVLPLLTSITDDQTFFSGQNLVFDKLIVGTHALNLECAEARACSVKKPGFNDADDGLLYFVTNSGKLGLMLISDKGIQVVAPHRKKKEEPATGPKQPAALQNPETLIQKNSEIRVYSVVRPN
jgi:hypothetical protein